jgi:hypothetical protein
LWKNELVKCLFSSDPSKLNVKKAINLKYENTPSSLYKYKSFNKNSLKLLETDKIYLARPTEFNDPFDCGLKMASKDLPDNYIKEIIVPYTFNALKQEYNCSYEEYDNLMRSENVIHDLAKFIVEKDMPYISPKERDKYIEEDKKRFIEANLDPGLKENIYVTCFSETYESIVMWSHYANDHKGFCIEYDFKELGVNDPVARFIFPVIYSKTLFDMKDYLQDPNKDFGNVLKSYMDNIKEKDILNGITLPKLDQTVNNMVGFYNALIKSGDWAYEKEWRYIFIINTNKSVYLTVPKPKAIYLGAKILKENGEKILKIAKERDITVYKMKIKPSEFALEPDIIYESNNIQEYNKRGKRVEI